MLHSEYLIRIASIGTSANLSTSEEINLEIARQLSDLVDTQKDLLTALTIVGDRINNLQNGIVEVIPFSGKG